MKAKYFTRCGLWKWLYLLTLLCCGETQSNHQKLMISGRGTTVIRFAQGILKQLYHAELLRATYCFRYGGYALSCTMVRLVTELGENMSRLPTDNEFHVLWIAAGLLRFQYCGEHLGSRQMTGTRRTGKNKWSP